MSNEITVRLLCNINEICNLLENKNFKVVDRFFMDDTYYVQKSIDILKLTPRDILKNCVLIRDITQYVSPKESTKLKMTYNSAVNVYNTKIETIPTNIIANIFHFEKSELFKVEDEEARKNVKVSF